MASTVIAFLCVSILPLLHSFLYYMGIYYHYMTILHGRLLLLAQQFKFCDTLAAQKQLSSSIKLSCYIRDYYNSAVIRRYCYEK